MVHKIRIKPVPHINKDGSPSASKKDYQITDRSRGKTVEVGVVSSKSAVEVMVNKWRARLIETHLHEHPKDRAFQRKHGLVEIKKEN